MASGFETLPPYILQEILFNGKLEALDLANLEVSSYTFRAASGIEPYRFKSITELAAHHKCQKLPLFQYMPGRARSELLAKCEGNWKLMLRFLRALQQPAGCSGDDRNKVLVAAGKYHSLLVNENGNLFVCGMWIGVLDLTPAVTSMRIAPAQFCTQPAQRIVQISGSHSHAAFITETGELYTFGDNSSCCCGVGENGKAISKPALVTSLKGTPLQQVSTGQKYTIALTRSGEVYSWGCAAQGQLGHGNLQEQLRPMQIEEFGESNPVAQISAGICHTLAVTRSGALYSWGYGSNHCLGHDDVANELRPRKVEHGDFDELFIATAVAGAEHSVAIDYLGQVYTWGKGYCGALGHGVELDQTTPLLVSGLKDVRVVQVAASRRKTFVLADDGTLYAFGWRAYDSLGVQGPADKDKVLRPHSLVGTLGDQKVVFVSAGQYHTLVLTKKGVVLGMGDNERFQFGITDVETLTMPTEVFTSTLTSK